jgi:hypothetical protein
MMVTGKGARAMRKPRRPPVRLSIKIGRGETRTWSRHDQGIVKDERGQEQPADKKRVQHNQ